MNEREIIFEGMPGTPVFGRELRFEVDGRNRLRWQTIPQGEEGSSGSFADILEAVTYAQGYAESHFYSRKLEAVNPPVGWFEWFERT